MSRYAILILAAGASTRLGKPKQLLPFNDTTLLDHTIQQAVAVPEAVTFVVINTAGKEVTELSVGSSLHMVLNDEAKEGIASSVRIGIRNIMDQLPGVDGCIISVCDQPFLKTALLQELISKNRETGKGIVAAFYDHVAGTPVLFDRKYFPDLLELTGDTGARKLLKRYEDDLAVVPFLNGEIDIDTEEDYLRLIAVEKNIEE